MKRQLVFAGDTRWKDITEEPGFSNATEIIVDGNLKSDTIVMTNASLQVNGDMNVESSVYVADIEVNGDLEFRNLLEASGNVSVKGNLFVHSLLEVEGNLEVEGSICKNENFKNSYCEVRVDGDLHCKLADVDKLYSHGEISGDIESSCQAFSKGNPIIEDINVEKDYSLERIGFKLGMSSQLLA